MCSYKLDDCVLLQAHTPTPTYIYPGGRVYTVHNHTVAVTLYILTPGWALRHTCYEHSYKKKKVLYHILLNFSFVIFFLFFFSLSLLDFNPLSHHFWHLATPKMLL